MNYIDIIVLITLAFAIFNGWRKGAIVQICSLVGIVIGIWLATMYGAQVGAMLHMGEDYLSIGGFLVVLVGVLIGVAVLSRLIKRLSGVVGLGGLDVILGIALSICKFGLILSVLFSLFDAFNNKTNIVSVEILDDSKLFRPIANISDSIFPALDWTQKQINSGIENL